MITAAQLFAALLKAFLYSIPLCIIFIIYKKRLWFRAVYIQKFKPKHVLMACFFNREGCFSQIIQAVVSQDRFYFQKEFYEVNENAIWKESNLKQFIIKRPLLSYSFYIDGNPKPLPRAAILNIFKQQNIKWNADTLYKKFEEKLIQDLLIADSKIKLLTILLIVAIFLILVSIILIAMPYFTKAAG